MKEGGDGRWRKSQGPGMGKDGVRVLGLKWRRSSVFKYLRRERGLKLAPSYGSWGLAGLKLGGRHLCLPVVHENWGGARGKGEENIPKNILWNIRIFEHQARIFAHHVPTWGAVPGI